ncbi:MAG: type II toxin-antitoxin system HicA family toxin [Dehalococcoidia bacterium]|nr:type II toxin-antitoxin system HicA family toxin [Dehalococcoidia bacterium]
MKRRDLIRHLTDFGCELRREGGNHSVYWNPANEEVAAIPRHSEIPINLARSICKQLEIEPPPRRA